MKKRFYRILVCVFVSVVLLEVCLQIASLFVAYAYDRNELTPGDEGGKSILCIGDSFTYGVGASSPDNSYPSVMNKELTDRLPLRPNLINAGWPGQNSRDLLAKLENQLEQHEPDLVFILIGINDKWSMPNELLLEPTSVAPDTAEPASQWKLRWRTGRLLLWFYGNIRPAKNDCEDNVENNAGSESGMADATANRQSPQAEIATPKTPMDRGTSLLAKGDLQGAIREFQLALQTQPGKSAKIHQGLVQAYSMSGSRELALKSLNWLEDEYAREPGRETTEALVISLAVVREMDRAVEIARKGVAQFPESSTMWWFLGEEYYRRAQLTDAEAAYDRAIESADKDDPDWNAILLRCCARTCAERDPEKAFKQIVAALLIDQDFPKSMVALDTCRKYISSDAAKRWLEELSLKPDEQRIAQALLVSLDPLSSKSGLDEDHCRALESHVRQMIDRCVAHGAQPVLLTYPFPIPEVEAICNRLASQTSVRVIGIRERFDVALRRQKRDELFMPDGHCNDQGYQIMGKAAAEMASQLLKE